MVIALLQLSGGRHTGWMDRRRDGVDHPDVDDAKSIRSSFGLGSATKTPEVTKFRSRSLIKL